MLAALSPRWEALHVDVWTLCANASDWNTNVRARPPIAHPMSSTQPVGRRSASRGTSDQEVEFEPPNIDDLVVEHSAAVFRLARSVVQDAALADDVTQETFIKVWKHMDTFRGDSSLRSWILRIAHNTAVSTLRTIRDSATDPVTMPQAHDPIPTTRVVEGRLAADELRAALEQLDDLTREIVVLREVEGMSYEEIAETLEVPIPTVKTRLLRARRRLSVVLEDWRS